MTDKKEFQLTPEQTKGAWEAAIELYGSDKCEVCPEKATHFYQMEGGHIIGMSCTEHEVNEIVLD